jgi:S-adenosylmethionine hydrolase
MPGVVTLTTDFGLRDAYAAALEAAILTTAPEVRVVHVSHSIPPGDVLAGAYVVEYASRSFPPGAVHLCVVDPGVGSGRRILAVDAGGFCLIGPDNGVLRRAIRGREVAAVALATDRTAAPTFESRDVMAPAAARLASGEPLTGLGSAAAIDVDMAPLELRPHQALHSTIAHVDGFGSLVIDAVCPETAQPGWRLRISGHSGEILMRSTFSDVAPGQLVAYRGSIGYLEIAVRDGSAASVLGIGPGAPVEIELLDTG